MAKDAPQELPDIAEYLSENGDDYRVSTEGLEDLINFICSVRNITYPLAEKIVKLYFEQVRTQIIRGETVDIKFAVMKLGLKNAPTIRGIQTFKAKLNGRIE